MKHFILISLSLWIWVSACNDPVLVGSGLLDDVELNVGFVDSMTVKAKTIDGGRSLTFVNFADGSYSGTTYMVGQLDDGVFGKSEAVSYFTPNLIFFYPEFTQDNLDSVVLSIPLDSTGYYGDINAIHNLELKGLSSELELESDSALYSDIVLETGPLLASGSLRLNPSDSLSINAYTTANPDSTIMVSPQLRMQLDREMWINVVAPGDTLTSIELLESFPGFELSSTPSTSSMFGLNLGYTTLNNPSNIIFYYNLNDSVKAIYTIPLARLRHSTFTNDYSGSDVGQALDQEGEDLLYVQSQAGTEVALDISDVRNYDDQILNAATLQVTVKPEDENLYSPIDLMYAWAKDDSGDLQVIGVPVDSDNGLQETFEGGVRKLSYSIDITNHLNQVKKGNITTETADSIFLRGILKSQRPNRSILYGPEHSDFPLQIDLILTKP